MQTFRLGHQIRVFLPLFYIFAAFVAALAFFAAVSKGDTGGLVFLVAWCLLVAAQGSWVLLRMPWRIEADEREIRFYSRTRVVTIPWAQLRTVRSPWFDTSRAWIQWQWDGGTLRTMGPWDGQHRLLTTVEQRAPHVSIQGL